MDLHIYDMKLDPKDIVVLSGSLDKEDLLGFAGYVQVLHNIFPNPIVYVPDEITLDRLTQQETKQLIKDAFDTESLIRLTNIVSDALSEKLEENPDAV